jgi:hypothetical protein
LAGGVPAPLRQDGLNGSEEDRYGQRGLRLPDAELLADVGGEVPNGGLVALPLFCAKSVVPAAGGAQGRQGGPAVGMPVTDHLGGGETTPIPKAAATPWRYQEVAGGRQP